MHEGTLRKTTRAPVLVLAVALLALVASLPAPPRPAGGGGPAVPVIVRGLDPDAAAAAVTRVGGTVRSELPVLRGVAATVPEASLDRLASAEGVQWVVPDGRLELAQSGAGGDGVSLATAAEAIGAPTYWAHGLTGRGVDVALVDSGVAGLEELARPSKVVDGPDLSFESHDEGLRHVDTYGHGTHLAGIVAGRPAAGGGFGGIAPGARVVNVKVADRSGAADVSQVIAAIDWVVQHRRSDGLNIRVLVLAFGTDGTQDRRADPLAYAVEVAWHHGIVVVVASGNDGRQTGPLRNPASNPFVLAVGADDTRGTADLADDAVPDFSNRGNAEREPDLVAPGVSLVSLAAPGSTIVAANPGAAVGDRFLRGTGTSQATAIVAGAAALVLEQRPAATPDQVKALLRSTARRLPGFAPRAQGAGVVGLAAAHAASTPNWSPGFVRGTGTGTIEAARGRAHVARDGVELRGEWDVRGERFDSSSWAEAAAAGSTWSGGAWSGSSWSGGSWSGSSWSGSTWSGSTWSGSTWSGSTWSSTWE